MLRSMCLSAFVCAAKAWQEPSVELKNAANPGVRMTASGLGTGFDACYDGNHPDAALAPSKLWLSIGGRRFDGATSYGCDWSIGQAIKQSGVPRSEVFVASTVGPGGIPKPLGFNETLQQAEDVLKDLDSSYIDLLLVHEPFSYWPTPDLTERTPSSDPHCDLASHAYDEKECRLSTWRAMVQLWKSGKVHAIGVSNYNSTHINEIKDAGLPLPAVNQIEFNVFHGVNYPDCTCGRSSSRSTPTCDVPGKHNESCTELLEFHKQLGIVTNGYSPFSTASLKDVDVVHIAQAHNVTSSQVILNWQWSHGVLVNAQSDSKDHLETNLFFHDFELTAEDMRVLDSKSAQSGHPRGVSKFNIHV